jgi:hypothetical protein
MQYKRISGSSKSQEMHPSIHPSIYYITNSFFKNINYALLINFALNSALSKTYVVDNYQLYIIWIKLFHLPLDPCICHLSTRPLIYVILLIYVPVSFRVSACLSSVCLLSETVSLVWPIDPYISPSVSVYRRFRWTICLSVLTTALYLKENSLTWKHVPRMFIQVHRSFTAFLVIHFSSIWKHCTVFDS